MVHYMLTTSQYQQFGTRAYGREHFLTLVMTMRDLCRPHKASRYHRRPQRTVCTLNARTQQSHIATLVIGGYKAFFWPET